MYICTHAGTHTHTHTHTHACTHIHTHTHTHTHKHACTHTHTRARAHKHTLGRFHCAALMVKLVVRLKQNKTHSCKQDHSEEAVQQVRRSVSHTILTTHQSKEHNGSSHAEQYDDTGRQEVHECARVLCPLQRGGFYSI